MTLARQNYAGMRRGLGVSMPGGEDMTQYAGAAWNQLMENESKESIAELYLASIARERGMREALEPFVRLFEKARDRHMKRSAEAVALGRVWFDEMPGEWEIDLRATMADGRKARAALASGQPPGKEGGV